MGSLSVTHMVILFLIVLIIFGPKNLPKIGQALGRGIREFKEAAKGLSNEMEEEDRRSTATRREIPPVATSVDEPPVITPAPDTVGRTGETGTTRA
jgi:sec-independent protein translocase protein TatA